MSGFWLQLLLQVPNAMGLTGVFIAGRKRRAGWALGFLSEPVWILWGYLSHNPGIYPWCVVWGVIYARNWWSWRPHPTPPATGGEFSHPGAYYTGDGQILCTCKECR